MSHLNLKFWMIFKYCVQKCGFQESSVQIKIYHRKLAWLCFIDCIGYQDIFVTRQQQQVLEVARNQLKQLPIEYANFKITYICLRAHQKRGFLKRLTRRRASPKKKNLTNFEYFQKKTKKATGLLPRTHYQTRDTLCLKIISQQQAIFIFKVKYLNFCAKNQKVERYLPFFVVKIQIFGKLPLDQIRLSWRENSSIITLKINIEN